MEENTTAPEKEVIRQQTLPNSTAILVLGILSIVGCWCYGLVGLTLGIIALVISGKANKLYFDNPGIYTEGSFKNMRAGRICAIIGTSISALYFFIMVIYMMIIGAAITSIFTLAPWEEFL